MRRALAAAWEAIDAALLWLAFDPAGRWVSWRERRGHRGFQVTDEHIMRLKKIFGTAGLVLGGAAIALFILIMVLAVAFVFNR